MGDAEIALTREALGWKHPAFEIPSEIYAQWDAKEVGRRRSGLEREIRCLCESVPQEAAEFHPSYER